MRSSRLIVALVLGLVGAIWLGQGVGLIGDSFMSGSALWAVIGALLLAAAVAIVVLERRRLPKA